MPSRSFRRAALVLLLAGLLGAHGSSAAVRPQPPSARPVKASRPAAVDLLGRAWNLLTALWVKEGCNIDPNGVRCAGGQAAQPSSTEQLDTGCHIDPNGSPRCS